MRPLLSVCLLLAIIPTLSSVQVINNGLAPPEIVHQPVNTKPRCVIRAPPLDLIFILDSSGSLRNKFQDEIDIIRRIINHITIGPTATRVMLVQFSGTQHLEFNFDKFTTRDEVLAALDVLRFVSGITRIGGAFKFAKDILTGPSHGMRDPSVPKIIFLLSDGRTHDYPSDYEQAEQIRRSIPNVDIWAFGTGEYVALPAILNYTKSDNKIITSRNLKDLEPLFDKFRGTEVCDKVPVCIKGSDKPLDLLLVFDASESVDHLFYEQVRFAIDRIIANVHVHPDAVRVALITFSGNVFRHFTFDDVKFNNNTAVIRHLNTLRSIKGTTSTHLALEEAYKILEDVDGTSGVRPGVPKLVIVLTDGHSQRSPKEQAKRIRDAGFDILAVSVMSSLVDEQELIDIAGDPSKVFTPRNINEFEMTFLEYIGFGCPGIELGPDAKPKVRGSTDVTCDEHSLSFTVRTQRPMTGLMYAQLHHDDPKCVLQTDGSAREVSIRFVEGTCGLVKTPSMNRDGYNYNMSVILQFHPLIQTRADQGLDVNCFFPVPLTLQDIGRSTLKRLDDTTCTYRLHRYSPDNCVVLDAKVGENLYHKWDCDSPPNYQYLVHDCFARSEHKQLNFIDSDGCEVDVHFLETPNYGKFTENQRVGDAFVWQEMSVFKFPGDNNIQFMCKVSLCDMESGEPCTQAIPPKCPKVSPHHMVRRLKRDAGFDLSILARHKRQTQSAQTKPGFAITFNVETRTLNILENEGIRPRNNVKYCDIF